MSKEQYKDVIMPKFIMSFSGNVYPDFVMLIQGQLYKQEDFKCPIDSLHVYGKKDPLFDGCTEELDYFLPGHIGKPKTVIIHE